MPARKRVMPYSKAAAELENPPPSHNQPTRTIYIEFKHVAPQEVNIPEDLYQRAASQRFVKQLVKEGWDPGLANVILVSDRSRNVLDGGHRVRAARMLGLEQIPALIYHGLTDEEEAHYFNALNRKRRAIGLRDRQKSALYAREQDAVEAQAIIDVVKPKRIPLQTVVAANTRHPGVLANIAPTLAKMDTNEFSRDFIAGMVHFASAHQGILSEAVRDRLTEVGMYRHITEAIKRTMREHMEAHGRSALPTDWSVKAEGVLLALNTQPAFVPRDPVPL